MNAEQALTYAAALCNRAEYCTAEIAEKLRKKGLGPTDIRTVVRKLTDLRLIDDSRYAQAFVRQKVQNQLWGRRKIAVELRRKRIDADIIADALDQIDETDYLDILKTVIKRKARTLADPDDRTARAAIARYAIARGFEPSLIFDLLRH